MSYSTEITTAHSDLARAAYETFERRTRDSGTVYYVTVHPSERDSAISSDAPDTAYDLAHSAVYAAHGGMLPDDWTYVTVHDAFGAIADAGAGADASDAGSGFADRTDIYTSDLLRWLLDGPGDPSECDEAAEELNPEAGIIERIQLGQYRARGEIFGAVWSAVCDTLDEAETDTDDEEDDD